MSSYQAFVNSLSDKQIMYLIYRELGYNQKDAGRLLDMTPQATWSMSEQIKKKARRFGLVEAIR